MRSATLIALFAICAVTVATARQEVRIVTSDVTSGQLPPGVVPGGQPMQKGTGVLFGQVTEADSSRPVPGAIVTLNMRATQPLRVMADSQGRFGFRDLPKGAMNLVATRPGWVDGSYGRTRPGGPGLPLVLTDGERVSGFSIPMWRYASITGRVTDENGDPLINMPVQVLKRSIIGGQTKLTQGPEDTTDDRGIYRIGRLEPGEYVVAVPMPREFTLDLPAGAVDMARVEAVAVRATAVAGSIGGGNAVFVSSSSAGGTSSAGVDENGRPLAFPTTFYPNTRTSAGATLIRVASGEERNAVDFRLGGVPTVTISGLATGPDGPATNMQISLVPDEAQSTATPLETINGSTDGQGRFTIDNVPPGQYVLRALRMPRMSIASGETTTITQGGAVMVMRVATAGNQAPLPNEPTLWSEMPLSVGSSDLADVAIGLRPGIRVTGMLQFNGGAERPASDRLGSINISLEPADPRPDASPARGRVETSGQFATMGVPPGRYFIRVNGGYPGWTFHSAMVNGRDASVVPVELQSSDVGGVMITFTDRPTELSGQVTADGPPTDASVLVFPADSSAWVGYGSSSRRFANTRADKDGNFKVSNLPAGDYLAVAIPDKMANDWQNPEFLQSLMPSATRVRIRDGEKATASLRVAR